MCFSKCGSKNNNNNNKKGFLKEVNMKAAGVTGKRKVVVFYSHRAASILLYLPSQKVISDYIKVVQWELFALKRSAIHKTIRNSIKKDHNRMFDNAVYLL